jgi:hypothetical protein
MATKRKASSSRRGRSSPKRGSGKRELLKAPNATLDAQRTSTGRFQEMDEQSRSLASDRRRKATTRARAGYGDRGDRAA